MRAAQEPIVGRDAEAAKRMAGQRGTSLLEATVALSVLAIGAFSALATFLSSQALDEELKERSAALRAAMTRMEAVLAFDYEDDIANFVANWEDPANATFTVDGLRAPVGKDLAALPHGSITVDDTDPERISVVVRVDWVGRRGARSIAIPMIVTEVVE